MALRVDSNVCGHFRLDGENAILRAFNSAGPALRRPSLLLAFGTASGIVLAAIGLYGVIAHVVGGADA